MKVLNSQNPKKQNYKMTTCFLLKLNSIFQSCSNLNNLHQSSCLRFLLLLQFHPHLFFFHSRSTLLRWSLPPPPWQCSYFLFSLCSSLFLSITRFISCLALLPFFIFLTHIPFLYFPCSLSHWRGWGFNLHFSFSD